MTQGVSITQVAAALERVEAALADNLAAKQDLEKIKTSIRSLETLTHESAAATLGLAAIVASLVQKMPVSNAEVQNMLDHLTPPSDLGQLNRERAETLYGSILKAASEGGSGDN